MKLAKWLAEATKQLESAGIGTARLDCLILLEDATGKDRAWHLAHPEFEIDEKTNKIITQKLARRTTHEPIAYIRGFTEFYGRKFTVNKDVLEPRPESETMIDLLKKIGGYGNIILDVGTGSGALAITIKLELPQATVIATDIDPKCLKIARQNAKKLGADIKFYQGDLLDPLPSSIFHLPTTILANLPYVPDNYQINEAAAMEPRLAIFGGEDGLDLYRRLFLQIATKWQFDSGKPKYVLTESLPTQHAELTKIAESNGYKLDREEDFIVLFS